MTALQQVSLGTDATGKGGDSARAAFTKMNSNIAALQAQAALTSAASIITGNLTLTTAAHLGQRVLMNLVAASTITMMAAASAKADGVVLLVNGGQTVATIAAAKGDSVPLTYIYPGEAALFQSDGALTWYVISSMTRALPIMTLGAAVDLNTITIPGDYYQTQTSGAAGGANYPTPYTGLLEVRTLTNAVYQRYTAQTAGTLYLRNYNGTAWGLWGVVFDDRSNVTLGDVTTANASARTFMTNYRMGIARNSPGNYPFFIIANSALTAASPPAADTVLGDLQFRLGSTTTDQLSGSMMGDMSVYQRPSGAGLMGIFARAADGSTIKARIYLDADTSSVSIGSTATPGTTLHSTGTTSSNGVLTVGSVTGSSTAGYTQTAGVTLNPSGVMAVGSGQAPNSNYALVVGGTTVGTSATQYGVAVQQTFNASATNIGYVFATSPKVVDSGQTMSSIYAYNAGAPSIGDTATLKFYAGYNASDAGTPANDFSTGAYGFRGTMNAGTTTNNRWNLYMSGSAPNFMAGRLQVGGLTDDLVTTLGIKNPVSGGYGARIVRNNTSGQYLAFGSAPAINATATDVQNHIVSYTTTSNAKQMVFNSTTDDAGTAATSGGVGFQWQMYGSTQLALTSAGVLVNGNPSGSSITSGGANCTIQNHGTSGGNSSIGSTRWSNDAAGATLYLGKSRGAAVGTQAAIQSGDLLGMVQFCGSDASAVQIGAQVAAMAAETWSSTARGSHLDMHVSVAGSTNTYTACRFASSGNTLLATTTDNGVDKLQVAGTVYASGAVKVGQFTKATVPSASVNKYGQIIVTDATGGAKLCVSDGTNWYLANTTTLYNA